MLYESIRKQYIYTYIYIKDKVLTFLYRNYISRTTWITNPKSTYTKKIYI